MVLQQNRRGTVSSENSDHLPADLLTPDQGEAGTGDRPTELIGHSGEEAGDLPTDGGPSGGVATMGMHDATDLRQLPVDVGVSGGVGRRLKITDTLQSPNVDLDHTVGLKLLEQDPARLDNHSVRARLTPADITAGPANQIVPG